METVEKRFKCPFCLEKISMILDPSEEGEQVYIEDCEVCCHPIQLSYHFDGQVITRFQIQKAYD